MDLPTLRAVTQAGGRLAPDTVRRYAQLGQRKGWELVVMYGQTEATARMAYLPPKLAIDHPGAVGVAIPGGSFEIAGGGDEGELLYRGPNVMLGSATGPDDLATGRVHDVLHTGDVARRTPDGLIEVVGRLSRFVKLFGLRVDLDEIERLLADRGHHATCTGDDDSIVVAVPSGSPSEVIHELVRARVGLPPGAIRVVQVAELPRLANGKPDYDTVRALARRRVDGDTDLRRAFTRILGCRALPDDATFVTLGGDSLSYVEMSIEIERIVGFVPDDWHRTTLADLERRVGDRQRRTTMETNVALRAVAAVLVVGTHAGAFPLQGGAHLVLAVAGFNFARFSVPPAGSSGLRRHLETVARIAVPSVLWLVALFVSPLEAFSLPKALLVNNYAGTGLWEYWYVEVIVQILMLLALVLLLPAVRSIEQRRPYEFAFALFVASLAIRFDVFGMFGGGLGRHPMYRTDTVLWLFLAGWVAQRAATRWQRLLVSSLVVLAVPGFFDKAPRASLVLAGVLVLVWCRRIPVPRRVIRPVSVLAAASLWIYLTQFAVFRVFPGAPPFVRAVLAVVVGVSTWASGRAALAARRRGGAMDGAGRRQLWALGCDARPSCT
jgi:peptidoglycan/LPS O-acetylase OafA/YrhL